ncbi:MAG: ribokinase [Nodosilinea sp.]
MAAPPRPTLHVFGSLNMDLVCQAPRLPVPGETLLGTQFQTVPGGKGANQAVAAARLGATTTMVGRLGEDDFGQRLMDSLAAAGVNTAGISLDPEAQTGVAAIVVDALGNNQIVVVPGANGRVDETDVERLAARFQPGDFLLMQFEVPLPAVLAAAEAAQAQGVRVMVDPAPARTDLPDHFYGLVDMLTPNQGEASQLAGFAVEDVPTAAAAAQVLLGRGANLVVVKLGADGAVIATPHQTYHQPALGVAVVDTVAAGDAFNGGLAVALAAAMPLDQASRFATAVAAHAVTQRGAQSAMPTRRQVDERLAKTPAPWLQSKPLDL